MPNTAPENPLVDGWSRVPDGSTFVVSALCDDSQETVTASFEMLSSTGKYIEKLLNSATGKEAKFPLSSPLRYSSDVLLHFDTAATATVTASIIKPDGSPHGDPYENTISRAQSEDVFVSFFIWMLK